MKKRQCPPSLFSATRGHVMRTNDLLIGRKRELESTASNLDQVGCNERHSLASRARRAPLFSLPQTAVLSPLFLHPTLSSALLTGGSAADADAAAKARAARTSLNMVRET